MPVERRQFTPGESPRLSNVEPQGAIEFIEPVNNTVPKRVTNANQPERHLITLNDSPSLDYAWAITQISVPIVLSLIAGEGKPPIEIPSISIRGFTGARIIFTNVVTGVQLNGTSSPTSFGIYNVNLTPFSPYPIQGGEQISIEFALNTSTNQFEGANWSSEMLIGWVFNPTFDKEGKVPLAKSTPFPGVLSYRYV